MLKEVDGLQHGNEVNAGNLSTSNICQAAHENEIEAVVIGGRRTKAHFEKSVQGSCNIAASH
jgi:hypothetical protein